VISPAPEREGPIQCHERLGASSNTTSVKPHEAVPLQVGSLCELLPERHAMSTVGKKRPLSMWIRAGNTSSVDGAKAHLLWQAS